MEFVCQLLHVLSLQDFLFVLVYEQIANCVCYVRQGSGLAHPKFVQQPSQGSFSAKLKIN